MYIVKRTHPQTGEIAYYTHDGWALFSDQGPIDLTGVVLFTKTERELNTLRPSDEWQWYGAYKR